MFSLLPALHGACLCKDTHAGTERFTHTHVLHLFTRAHTRTHAETVSITPSQGYPTYPCTSGAAGSGLREAIVQQVTQHLLIRPQALLGCEPVMGFSCL